MDKRSGPSQGVSGKIVRNTIYNFFGRAWGAIVGLFLIPYIIHYIGLERFGLWAIMTVITGYFALFDCGVGSTFVKFISDCYTKGDFGRINRIINTGLLFYSIFGLVVMAVTLLFVHLFIGFFKIPPGLLSEAKLVVVAGVFLFVCNNALGPLSSIQSGLQRMDISNKVAIGMSCLNVAGVVFFLKSGFGLNGLIMNSIILFGIVAVINITIALRLVPSIRLGIGFFDWPMMNALFNFGYRVQITKISGVITAQTDKILIVYFLSLGLVSFYQLGSGIVGSVIGISSVLIAALIPAFTEIESKGERIKLIEAYLMTTKYLAFLMVPAFIFLFISAFHIMSVWMGEGYDRAAFVVQILALSSMINVIAQVASSTCLAIDKPQLMARGSVIVIVLNIILSLLFIKLMGFYGVAWGTMIASNAGTLYFLVTLHKALGIPVRKFFQIIVPYLAAGIFAAAFVYVFDMLVNYIIIAPSRPLLFIMLLARGIVFTAAYIPGIRFGKSMSANDIVFLQEKLPFARAIIRSLA
jgi:O-antigen/teichoic acid export membrane protein